MGRPDALSTRCQVWSILTSESVSCRAICSGVRVADAEKALKVCAENSWAESLSGPRHSFQRAPKKFHVTRTAATITNKPATRFFRELRRLGLRRDTRARVPTARAGRELAGR